MLLVAWSPSGSASPGHHEDGRTPSRHTDTTDTWATREQGDGERQKAGGRKKQWLPDGFLLLHPPQQAPATTERDHLCWQTCESCLKLPAPPGWAHANTQSRAQRKASGPCTLLPGSQHPQSSPEHQGSILIPTGRTPNSILQSTPQHPPLAPTTLTSTGPSPAPLQPQFAVDGEKSGGWHRWKQPHELGVSLAAPTPSSGEVLQLPGILMETPSRRQRPPLSPSPLLWLLKGVFFPFFFFFSPSFKKNSYQFNIILVLSNNSYLKRSLRWL